MTYHRCYHDVCMSSGIQLVQQEKKQHKISSAKRARRHWQLLYTLVNNPSLVGTRKHFQRQTTESFLNGSLNRSAKEGSKKEVATKEAEAAASNWERMWPRLRIGCKAAPFGFGKNSTVILFLLTPAVDVSNKCTYGSVPHVEIFPKPFLSGDGASTSCSLCPPGCLYVRATVSSQVGKLVCGSDKPSKHTHYVSFSTRWRAYFEIALVCLMFRPVG